MNTCTATLPHPEVISVDLPYPVGVNRVTRFDRGRAHKATNAREWQESAARHLLLAGMRRLEPGEYRVRIEYTLYACNGGLDLDAPLKLLMDTIELNLGISDAYVVEINGHLERVPHRNQQKLAVTIEWEELAV